MISTVQNVQAALNILGYANPPLVQDGVSGPLTQAAIKQFQTDYSLTVDGVAGSQTKAALTAALATNTANSSDPSVLTQAQALINQDNTSPPTNTTAVHLPPTPSSPAMTIHTTTTPSGGTSTAVKPFGTPTSLISSLAKTTGATPAAKANVSQKMAAMTSGQKLGWGLGIAGALAGAYYYFGGKK